MADSKQETPPDGWWVVTPPTKARCLVFVSDGLVVSSSLGIANPGDNASVMHGIWKAWGWSVVHRTEEA